MKVSVTEDPNGNGIIDDLHRSPASGKIIISVTPTDQVEPGTLITLNASRSALACFDTSIQFRFSKAAGFIAPPSGLFTLLQDWSGLPTAEDVALVDSTYMVEIRCAPNTTDIVLLQQQSQPVASDYLEVEVIDLNSKPKRAGNGGGQQPFQTVLEPDRARHQHRPGSGDPLRGPAGRHG